MAQVKSGTQAFIPQLGLNKIVANTQQHNGIPLTEGRHNPYIA